MLEVVVRAALCALLLAVDVPGGGAGGDFLSVETDPAKLAVVHDAGPVAATYNADRTVLTVATADPAVSVNA